VRLVWFPGRVVRLVAPMARHVKNQAVFLHVVTTCKFPLHISGAGSAGVSAATLPDWVRVCASLSFPSRTAIRHNSVDYAELTKFFDELEASVAGRCAKITHVTADGAERCGDPSGDL
jgi:hypothetical protein